MDSAAVPIVLAIEDDLARIRLNRPHKRNAMSRDMWRAIPGLVARAEATPARLLLLDSMVEDCFCAGADIAEFEATHATPAESERAADEMQAALDAISRARLPSIAVIRGLCVGGGCSLALACDLRLAAGNARFAITPAKLGIVYSHAQTQALVAHVGPGRAKDMLFSGRMLDAAEAYRIGLIDRLWPADSFGAESDAYLRTLSTVSPVSLRATKQIVDAIAAGAYAETPHTRALFLDAFSSDDFREGHRAFLGKHPAKFTGT
jgi:enoyl-CoA hydratase/carnithine racemase